MATTQQQQQEQQDQDHVTVVRGTVSWDSSRPLADVVVELIGAVDGETHRIAEAHTNEEGRFETRLAGIDASRVSIRVRSRAGVLIHTTEPIGRCGIVEDLHVGIGIPDDRRDLLDPRRPAVPTVHVGSTDVNAAVLEGLTPDDLVVIARAQVDLKVAKEAGDLIDRLSPDLNPLRPGPRVLCSTPTRDTIDEIIALKRWPRELRVEIDRIFRNLDSGFATKTHDCGNFTITYQTTGTAAVDSSTAALDIVDPGTTDVIHTIPAGGTVPTYIRLICFWANRAMDSYINAPFSLKNPAAGGKIAVNVTSTQFGSANASGFTIGNALNQEILAAVTVHELFHMVQFEYGLSGVWRQTMMEGGAVFAEDVAADRMNRYLYEASSTQWSGMGVMPDPNKSIKSASYDGALFLRYIAEQQAHDVWEPFVGVDTYRALIERCEADGCTTAAIRQAVRELPYYHDLHRFHYLDAAQLDRTNSETVFGNYALACYLKDLGTSEPDRRFEFIEDEETIAFDDVLNAVAGPFDTHTNLASPAVSGTATVTTSSSASFSGSVTAFGTRYYVVPVDGAVGSVSVSMAASSGFADPLFQIALIDDNGAVRDIHRSDSATYSKRITNDRDGVKLDRIVLVVSGADSAGSFTITAASAAAAPDVMVTRWHTVAKREYEIDSRYWAWTWVSPDIWVDNDNDGVADGSVYFDFDNQLNIRLHNKGNADAAGVQVQFWYQNAAGGLSDTKWLPVKNKAGVTQTLTGLSLAAGASNNWSVDWSPVVDGTSKHFCVRAVVTSPGDGNTDNKRVLSNFGNVVVKPGGFIDLVIIRRNLLEELRDIRLVAVPRLPFGLELERRDLVEQRVVTLGAGEERLDRLMLTHLGELEPRKATRRPRYVGRDGCAAPIHEVVPDVSGHYDTDPRALPPGVAGRPMVTLTHVDEDGLVVGGVTLMVTEGDEQEIEGRIRKAAS